MKKRVTYVFGVMFLLCISVFTGCGIGKEAGVEEGEQGTELLVYYVGDHPYYGTALGAFIYANLDYDITLKNFETDEEMCNLLQTEIAAGQGPDVVLMTSESDFDFYKAVKSGNLADMGDYFMQDEEFSADHYYETVFDGGKLLDGQYGVPFSFSLESLIVNQAVLEEAGITVDDRVGKFDDILSLCEKAIEKADGETIAFIAGRRNTLLNATPRIQTDIVGRYLENSGISLISAEGEVVSDIEKLQNVVKFLSNVQQEYKEKEAVQKQMTQGMDASKILCMSFNGSYVFDPLIAEHYTEEMNELFVSVPWKNVEGQAQPIVCDYGIVNRSSKSKEAAYQLLKYLMDYEVPQAPGHPLSINRNIVEKQLNKMQQKETILTDMTLSKLNEEDCENIQSVLDSMATAIIYNTGYYDIVVEKLRECLNGGSQEAVLMELQSELERYLRE